MEATIEPEWVTAQDAIYTLVQLKALRVGDELKLKPLGGWPNARPGIGVITEVVDDTTPDSERTCYWDGYSRPAVALIRKIDGSDHPNGTGTWRICLENIVAWRRP